MAIIASLNPVRPKEPIVYPSSDGKRMAENSLQYQWIVTLRENINEMFIDRGDVLVVADNLIYPEEGFPKICTAPDVYIAFGRPPGHRPCYMVWAEANIFPQVIFEVLSPSNRAKDMLKKKEFYEHYGVEEYYVIDPDTNSVEEIWLRSVRGFRQVENIKTFRSPRLGIRFDWSPDGELQVIGPKGNVFLSWQEQFAVWEEGARRARESFARAEIAEKVALDEIRKAEGERRKAEDERRKAEDERRKAEEEKARADRLAAKLRELGLDPEAP